MILKKSQTLESAEEAVSENTSKLTICEEIMEELEVENEADSIMDESIWNELNTITRYKFRTEEKSKEGN